MVTHDPALFAITLYVPDATVFRLSDMGSLQRILKSGVPELDFLPPPWWEESHTVRLGLAQNGGTNVKAGEASASATHPNPPIE